MCLPLSRYAAYELEQDLGRLSGLDARPVIDEVADGQLLGELRDSADVVGVEVRDHQVIDALDARLLRCRGDPLGVAAVETAPAGVDQQRLAARRHHQSGLPALHVDEVNFEILGGGQQTRRGEQQNGLQQQFHGENVSMAGAGDVPEPTAPGVVWSSGCHFAANAETRWDRRIPTAAAAARGSRQRRSAARLRCGRGLESLNPKTASILCYIPWVGWVAAIVVLASDRFRHDRAVRFHAFQGLYLFVAWLIADQVIRPMFDG